MTLASCSGLIVSYERQTGKRVWEYDAKRDGSAQNFHGEMTRQDSTLFIPCDPMGGHVYRLNALTGEVIWKWRSKAGVTSDVLLHQGSLFFVTEDNRLTRLDATSGTLLWQTEEAEGSRIAPIKPTPVMLRNGLIFGRSDGRVSRHRIWLPQPEWELRLPSSVTTDLVVIDETVIFGTMDGYLYRLDANGYILEKTFLSSMPAYRWMRVDGDRLIGLTGISGADRELLAVDLKTFEVLWRLRSPNGEGWTTAQPAIGWNSILVGNAEPALYAVDPSSGQIVWRAETQHPPRTVTVDGGDLFLGTFDGTLNVYRRSKN